MDDKLPCEIVRDLLPSYADALTGEVTNAALEAHLAQCPDCARLYEEMKAPEIASEPENIDYLKKVKNRTRRVVAIVICLCLAAAAGLVAYFVTRPAPDIPPQVSYDARTHIVTVIGHGDYSELVWPEEIEKAYQLKVQDDAFDLTLNLHLFEMAENKAELISAFVRSCAGSVDFYQQTLPEMLPGILDAQAQNPHISLELSAMRNLLYEYDADGNELCCLDVPAYHHWGAVYLLSQLNEESYGWKQLAFAYYTEFLVNPDNWLAAQGQAQGGYSLQDCRAAFDEAAGKAILYGFGDWGTPFEARPMSEIFPALGGEGKSMSVSMAVSFLAWLADRHGYETVARWAQGELDFADAFGMDFERAYTAWLLAMVEKAGMLSITP